jgi:hypothetical protein
MIGAYDEALRDIRRRRKAEPGNIDLQRQVDHLDQIFPEARPWDYERAPTAGVGGLLAGFLLVGVIFTCGLCYHRTARAGGGFELEHPAQQVAISEHRAPEAKMTWTEGATAIGVFLGGVGALATWGRSRRRG